jgi:hypothetical protein
LRGAVIQNLSRGERVTPGESSPEPEKPKPKGSPKTVANLRKEVKAKDKFFVQAKPEAEAIEHITKEYRTDDASALAFVQWIKGPGSGRPPENPSRGEPIDSWHHAGNLQKATEELLSDEQSAKVRAEAFERAKAKKKNR